MQPKKKSLSEITETWTLNPIWGVKLSLSWSTRHLNLGLKIV